MGGVCAILGTLVSVGLLVRAMVGLFDPALDKVEALKSLPGVAVGLLFAYIGYWFLLWKDELSFDPSRRVYRRKRGWGPWAGLHEGKFSDFECIRFRMTRNKSGRFWHASLHWKALPIKCPEFDLFKHRDSLQTMAEARRLAAALDIAVDPSAVEAQRQIDSSASARDLAWKQRLRPYKLGLAGVIVLLVINSVLPGFHWRDGWTDHQGRVFERRSTLFHTLTRVESAGRPIGHSDVKWFLIGNTAHRSGFLATTDVPTAEKVDYHWGIGVGRFPAPEDSLGQPRAGKATR